MPRKEAEEAVAKIRERKMGRLFENVTFDYQAEMEYMRNRSREMDEHIKEIKECMKEMDERMKEMDREKEELKKERAKQKEELIKEMAIEREQEQRIMQQIYKMLLRKCPDTEIEEFLIQNFSISKEKAREEIRKIKEN